MRGQGHPRGGAEARRIRDLEGRGTILFIDEVHRFNKSQQDAFLPHVEEGTLIFIGATTENPSFELNNALLSRARVYVLKSLRREIWSGSSSAPCSDPSVGWAAGLTLDAEQRRQWPRRRTGTPGAR